MTNIKCFIGDTLKVNIQLLNHHPFTFSVSCNSVSLNLCLILNNFLLKKIDRAVGKPKIEVGVCVPDTCSAENLQTIIRAGI